MHFILLVSGVHGAFHTIQGVSSAFHTIGTGVPGLVHAKGERGTWFISIGEEVTWCISYYMGGGTWYISHYRGGGTWCISYYRGVSGAFRKHFTFITDQLLYFSVSLYTNQKSESCKLIFRSGFCFILD